MISTLRKVLRVMNSRDQVGFFTVWLFLLVLLAPIGCGRGGSGSHRLSEFNVQFGDHNIPAQMTAGQTVTADVAVKNTSKNTWPSKPDEKGHKVVNLSYHWLDRRSNVVVFDGLRTPLPHDVGAGESVQLKASIQAPDRAGQYKLEVTLVQEAVAWFPERNGDKLTIPVVVVEKKPGDLPISGKQVRTEINSPVENKPSLHPDKTRAPLPEKSIGNLPTKREKTRPANTELDKVKIQRDQGTPQWTVQTGAFAQQQEADNVAKKLRDKGHDAYVVVAVVNGREWHRVRVGRLASRAEAEKLQEILRTKESLKQALVTNSR